MLWWVQCIAHIPILFASTEQIARFLVAGLEKIEFLQSHSIRDIYQKAYYIIEQYFNSEDEEDIRVAPSANNNQYQFNADQSVPMGGYQF